MLTVLEVTPPMLSASRTASPAVVGALLGGSSVHDFSGRTAGPLVANNLLVIDRVELPLDQRARI